MIRPCVTISVVPKWDGGPFIFWNLQEGCRRAKELGYEAIELFPAGAKSLQTASLRRVLHSNGLKLAAVGSGAGWRLHGLQLSDGSARALTFVRDLIDAASELEASVVIGSMQGRPQNRARGLRYLASALRKLSERASQPILLEPLNRYETNLVNTLEQGTRLIRAIGTPKVRLLADLFHMNIEETDMAKALGDAGKHIGHVQISDSNRRPPGMGHTDFRPIARTLLQSGYEGYISAEALPYPDSFNAAKQAILAINRWFGNGYA